MNESIAATLVEHLDGTVRMPADLARIRTAYKAGQPFSHVVLDDLFEPALLARVLAEGRALQASQFIKFERDGLERTARMSSPLELGPTSASFVALLHSAPFLYLLSEITGVWQLLPDPYLQGAGHAVMRRGDFFGVHADRSVAYETGLVRRLAMIVFLNEDWSAEFNGNLELWDAEGKACQVAIAPVFNRTVLFEVAYPNYHGVPQTLCCPPERGRHSFIVYFHTASAVGKENVSPHSSRFAPQAYRRKEPALYRLARRLMPPVVLDMFRRLRGRSLD